MIDHLGDRRRIRSKVYAVGIANNLDGGPRIAAKTGPGIGHGFAVADQHCGTIDEARDAFGNAFGGLANDDPAAAVPYKDDLFDRGSGG